MQTDWVFYDLHISTLRVIIITIGRIASPGNDTTFQVSVRSHTENLESSQVKVTTLAHYNEQDFQLKEQYQSTFSKYAFAHHVSVS